jgi:N-carbamoylputrescine amidase
MRAALIQMSCQDDPRENLDKAVIYLRDAAREGAQIICLPELFQYRYFPTVIDNSYFSLAETVEEGSTKLLGKIAEETGAVIISGIFEKGLDGAYYNTAVIIGPEGKIIGIYRKNHIPLTPSLKEKHYFRPGDLGFPVFNTPFGRIGVLICYDRYFPEGFRRLAFNGAVMIFIPSACAGDSNEVWELLLRAHALSNLVFIGAANRIGREGDREFYGTSLFLSPWGEVMKKASGDKEEIVIADLDREILLRARERWPFYRDLRDFAYYRLSGGGD